MGGFYVHEKYGAESTQIAPIHTSYDSLKVLSETLELIDFRFDFVSLFPSIGNILITEKSNRMMPQYLKNIRRFSQRSTEGMFTVRSLC